jgi:hypothetical protein
MGRVENTASNRTSIFACVSAAAQTYLPSRCLETALVYLFMSRSLHSNGSTPSVSAGGEGTSLFLWEQLIFR